MPFQSIFRPGLFADQTIVITGGGSGIGRVIARELTALSAHAVIAGRRASKLERVVDEVSGAGGSASHVVCNIRKPEDVEALFESVLAQRGAIHGLVNNAGGQYLSPAEKIKPKGWRSVVETNLTGTFMMCREAFNRCMSASGGAIVNVVSEMWRGFPGMAHSGAARAGVVNLTRTLAVEWARAGVRVNAVAPGVIDSSGLDHYGEALQPLLEQIVRDTPAKRLGTEAEVAAVVVFLLSPAAAYISGETIRVDGASSLWRKPWDIPDHDNWPRFDGFAPAD